MLELYVISRNITEIKKFKLDINLQNINNIDDFLTFLLYKKYIYSKNYNIYYNNIKLYNINDIKNISNIKLTILESNITQCSCI